MILCLCFRIGSHLLAVLLGLWLFFLYSGDDDCGVIELSALIVNAELSCTFWERGGEGGILAPANSLLSKQLGQLKHSLPTRPLSIRHGNKHLTNKDIIKQPIRANNNNIPFPNLHSNTNSIIITITIKFLHSKLIREIKWMLLLWKLIDYKWMLI